ncbi:hypothetical protein J6590_103990, partial [Homalodisca vitripennis]
MLAGRTDPWSDIDEDRVRKAEKTGEEETKQARKRARMVIVIKSDDEKIVKRGVGLLVGDEYHGCHPRPRSGKDSGLSLCDTVRRAVYSAVKTTVILCTIPYRYDKAKLNTQISDANQEFKNNLDIPNLVIHNINSGLVKKHYTRHGLHMNKTGKKVMSRILAKCIEQCYGSVANVINPCSPVPDRLFAEPLLHQSLNDTQTSTLRQTIHAHVTSTPTPLSPTTTSINDETLHNATHYTDNTFLGQTRNNLSLMEEMEKLIIVSYNIRSVKNKIPELVIYLDSLPRSPDVLCLQETWTDADTEALLHTVPGYRLVSCYSRSEQKAGGTAILAKSNLKTNSVKNMNRIKCIDGTFEYSVAEVLKDKRNTAGWMTWGIKTSCKRKRELYEAQKSLNSPELTKYYKKYCKILRKVILASKKMANDRFILDARNRPQAMWDVVNRETSSVLGPLLFLNYVNDFSPNLTTLSVVVFADDTTIKTKSLDDLENKINQATDEAGQSSDISATRLGRPDWRLKPLWGCKYACGRRGSECATTTNRYARRGFVQCAMLRNHILLVRTAPAFNVQ